MTALDLAGHAGYVSLFFGSQLLARQNKYGWLCRLVGEFIWVVLGFILGLTSIWMWGIFFIFFNDLYGFWKWSKAEKLKEREKRGRKGRDYSRTECPYTGFVKMPEIDWNDPENQRDNKRLSDCEKRFHNPHDFPGLKRKERLSDKLHKIAEGESDKTDPDLLEPKGKRVTKQRTSNYDQDAAWKRRGGLGRSPAPRQLVDPKTLTCEKLAVMKTWYPELLEKTAKEKAFERLNREGESKW